MFLSSKSTLMNGKICTPLIIFVLGLVTSFAPFATDMYLSGLPSIAISFHTDVGRAQLTLSTFFFGLAVGQVFYGPLSDRYGRRRPLIFGIILFTCTSFLELLTQDMSVFIGLRFLQAIGGCAGMIIGRAVVSDLFEEQEAARVFSFLMLVQGIGPIVAPVLGSVLISVSSWRMILVFLTSLGTLCLVAALFGLPETLPPERHQKLGLKHIGQIMGTLIRRRAFIVPAVSGGLAMACMFVFISGSPFVLMNLYGVTPRHYGFLFALNAIGMTVASQINAGLLKRYKVTVILKGAFVFASCVMGILFAITGTSSLLLFLFVLFVGLAVLPVIAANSTSLAMSASGSYAGNASTIIGVIQFSLAGLASFLVSSFHNDTAYPLTGFIFGCAALGSLVFVFGSVRNRPDLASQTKEDEPNIMP